MQDRGLHAAREKHDDKCRDAMPTPKYSAQCWPNSRRKTRRGRPAGDRRGRTEGCRARRCRLIEWPECDDAPTKYWLSTLPASTPIATLVDTAKLRWRIGRDFQDLKQEIGLDHYEGRGGEDSTITRRSRSRPTESSSSESPNSPLCALRQALIEERRRRTRATVRADTSCRRRATSTTLRPERHTSNSIATLRKLIAVALAKRLPRCPVHANARWLENKPLMTQ